MANNVDPDQIAPVWSGPALFAYAILSETLVYKILGHLTYPLQNLIINREDPEQITRMSR